MAINNMAAIGECFLKNILARFLKNGIIPLYTGYDDQGNFYVASEMKALMPVCKTVSEFPPGHILDSRDGELKKYYRRKIEL